jgi:hypothetical protein
MDLTEESEIIKTGVMVVVNKAESLKKKRRTRDWHQDRILDGLPHSGPRPFGWEEDRTTLRPDEAGFPARAIRERIKGKAVSTLYAEAQRLGLAGQLRHSRRVVGSVPPRQRMCQRRSVSARRRPAIRSRTSSMVPGVCRALRAFVVIMRSSRMSRRTG